MSLELLQARLVRLQETTASITELIRRLAGLHFQPGSIPLSSAYDDDDDDSDEGEEVKEGNIITELRDEITQGLKEQENDLELLRLQIEALPYIPPGRLGNEKETGKAALRYDAEAAGQEIKRAWTSYQQARDAAHKNLKAAQIAERKLLLASLANPPPAANSENPSTDSLPSLLLQQRRHQNRNVSSSSTAASKELAASTDITSALRRTHTLLSNELSRSQFAHDTLRESTAALAQLSENYSSLDSLLSSSRTLVGTLLKSQKSDTWYLETAFWVLVATIAWLVFRRWVYGPAWWLVWFPIKHALRAFYMAWMGVFTAVGLRSSREGVFASSELDVAATTGISPSATLVGMGVVPTVGASGGGDQRQHGQNQGGSDGMVEEVGKIIDETEQGRQGQEQEQPQEEAAPRNPKKRMWEEDNEAKKHEQQVKDEL